MKTLWKLQISLAVILVALMMAFTTDSWATLVTDIANYSFKIPALNPQPATSNTPGWTKTGSAGIERLNIYPHPPEGLNIAWIHTGSLSQVLTETVQANHKYTLGVFVAREAFSPTYTVQLVGVDNFGVDHILAETPASLGQYRVFNLVELSYTALPDDPYLNDHLKIILSSSGYENNFDLVTLDDTNLVPTPSTLLLLGSGLFGLAYLCIRRKARG